MMVFSQGQIVCHEGLSFRQFCITIVSVEFKQVLYYHCFRWVSDSSLLPSFQLSLRHSCITIVSVEFKQVLYYHCFSWVSDSSLLPLFQLSFRQFCIIWFQFTQTELNVLAILTWINCTVLTKMIIFQFRLTSLDIIILDKFNSNLQQTLNYHIKKYRMNLNIII